MYNGTGIKKYNVGKHTQIKVESYFYFFFTKKNAELIFLNEFISSHINNKLTICPYFGTNNRYFHPNFRTKKALYTQTLEHKIDIYTPTLKQYKNFTPLLWNK